jgi:cation:H+ antiporter
MNSTQILTSLGGGLILLTLGAELLVRGASKLAAIFGVPSLVIGLTVVAFGTSAPELAVSVSSAWNGQSDIALGNVVGSNIFNVLFILGLSAIITPLAVNRQLIRRDVPIMIAVSTLLLLLALDGSISRIDGLILFLGILLYTWVSIRSGRGTQNANPGSQSSEQAKPYTRATLLTYLALTLGGLALLVLGADLFVKGAVECARWLGLSELVIGLTIVAAGTSLPEVATSVVAALKKERDIAIGNVVGSNIFNILAVLGAAALVRPVAIAPAALSFDIPVMLAVVAACLPVFYTGLSIARWEGVLFLFYYAAYTTYLVMNAAQHAALPVYSELMLAFVIPITAVTLLVSSAREWKKAKP